MPKITPIQESFSAGEISPLMFMRYESKGYQEGVQEMTNMYADSRGASFSRGGLRHVSEFPGDDARIMAIPVNDLFFYTAIFTDQLLTMTTSVGHNPSTSYTENSSFNFFGTGWVSGTDGNNTSKVVFLQGAATLNVADANNRYVYVSQEVTLPATGNYSIMWSMAGNAPVSLKVGLTEDSGEMYDELTPSGRDIDIFTATATTVWVTARLDSDNVTDLGMGLAYLGISTEVPQPVTFVTPYLEQDLAALQGVASPSGGAMYILHERYPPYKIEYDREMDTFAFTLVEFVNDAEPPVPAQPPEWVEGSYPSCGDFFEGRLWLGGTVNEPQTFWASKSGLPETFVTTGDGTNADDPLEFTMAQYGRIEWIIGFKNLVIGTQNGEHIVTSEGGYITPSDIQVEQQSSYGSANIQPIQVGDQIFYVSADRRKLRAIQYEWQKNNWLSKDLTFNSEHITEAGIRHVTWQQNPKNLFHCILENGTVASMTYERSRDIYGWSLMTVQGKVIDATTAPIQGTDYGNVLIQYKDGTIAYENQSVGQNTQYMDSWVLRHPEPDGFTVMGLDHLEGFEVQVTLNGSTHPDRVVVSGEIQLEFESTEESVVIVGLSFHRKIVTLPLDKGAPGNQSAAAWMKRWNKIYTRTLNSAVPIINGERAPERFPSTPMDTSQPNINDESLKINLGFDRHAIVTIEQDLPRNLIVLGIFGELGQSIT